MNGGKAILIGVALFLLYLFSKKKTAIVEAQQPSLWEKTLNAGKRIFGSASVPLSVPSIAANKVDLLPKPVEVSVAPSIVPVQSLGSLFVGNKEPLNIVPVQKVAAPAPVRSVDFDRGEDVVIAPLSLVKGAGCVGCSVSRNTFFK